MINQDLFNVLACPVCLAPVKPAPEDKLQCVNCRRLYPIRDGIPILMESEAQEA